MKRPPSIPECSASFGNNKYGRAHVDSRLRSSAIVWRIIWSKGGEIICVNFNVYLAVPIRFVHLVFDGILKLDSSRTSVLS